MGQDEFIEQLKDMGAQQVKELESKRPPVADDYVTTAIHIPKWVLALLRNASVGRANRPTERLGAHNRVGRAAPGGSGEGAD
jgi:hypothetical protein